MAVEGRLRHDMDALRLLQSVGRSPGIWNEGMIVLRCLPLAICIVAIGCQRYSPQPLDLTAHRAAVDARDPGAAEVAAYARQLAGSRLAGTAAYNPEDGLTLGEAQAVALFFNPHLRTARLKARVPMLGAAEAGRWEDPELQVNAERIIESVERPWVIGGLLNLTIPLSGRLKAEKGKALAEAEVEQLRVLVEEQKLLAELRLVWLGWSATLEQASLTRGLMAELDRIVESAEKLRAAGELDPLDARLFRIERLTQGGKLKLLEVARSRRGDRAHVAPWPCTDGAGQADSITGNCADAKDDDAGGRVAHRRPSPYAPGAFRVRNR